MEGWLYILSMTLLWGIIAIAVVHVVMDNRQPAKTMAWALVIIFLPLVGIVFYLMYPRVTNSSSTSSSTRISRYRSG